MHILLFTITFRKELSSLTFDKGWKNGNCQIITWTTFNGILEKLVSQNRHVFYKIEIRFQIIIYSNKVIQVCINQDVNLMLTLIFRFISVYNFCVLFYSSLARKTHYEVLKLRKNCTDKEIKEAFIQMSKEVMIKFLSKTLSLNLKDTGFIYFCCLF